MNLVIVMSTGKKEDLEKTIEQFKNPKPPSKGQTWLRHRIDSQSGMIDLMLLDGNNTVEGMATKLAESYPDRPMDQLRKRVKDHIDHLQEGDERDHSSLHKDDKHQPHRLKLKEVNGKWMFDSENLI